MKRRFFAVVLIFAVLINVVSMSKVFARDDVLGDWVTIIMQGDTDSASDCLTFENALKNSGNGYLLFLRHGWKINSNGVAETESSRVTQSQFSDMKGYSVAYYSGHGDSAWSHSVYQPCLNSHSPNNKIFVADTFGIYGSNWQTAATIYPYNQLRVLILAACKQLDDNNAKYYARLMKVSGVRAVAGYYGTGPGTGIDDRIAQNFVQNCGNGTSVMSSWDTANYLDNRNHPWAVLVYFSNSNQYYRLPGFPGNTYSAPANGADVWIVKEEVENSVVTGARTMLSNEISPTMSALPLSISFKDTTEGVSLNALTREPNWDNPLSNSQIDAKTILQSGMNESLDNKIEVVYQVSKTIIDPDEGPVLESRALLEQTFQYYDTYNGIKIADSFVSVSIDGEGINNVTVNRKEIVPGLVESNNVGNAIMSGEKLLTEEAAAKCLLEEYPSLEQGSLLNISLAYVPNDLGEHVLCYEFMYDYGFYYVSVSGGKVM